MEEITWLARGGNMHVDFPVVSIGLEALTKEQLCQVAVSVKLEQARRWAVEGCRLAAILSSFRATS